MKISIRNIRTVVAALVCGSIFAACSDMFETDSTSVIYEEGNGLQSPNDSLYSVMGLLYQTQRLGEKYVLLGELRGDLMQATTDADIDIQDISNFEASSSNVYRNVYDYYQVINNSNYAITRMDTSLTEFQTKVMLPEFAQLKTIRAWVYWQLALVTGTVSWIEEPILSLEGSVADYPQVNQEQLAKLLIEDLKPYLGVRRLNYGDVDGMQSAAAFIPIELVLGDLYLFLNQYENAASMYFRYIDEFDLVMSLSYRNTWTDPTRTSVSVGHIGNWGYSRETITSLLYSSLPTAYHPLLIRMTYNDRPFLVPAPTFVESMSKASFLLANVGVNNITGYFEGDMRGQIVPASGSVMPSAYGAITLNESLNTYITKYWYGTTTSVSGTDPENDALGGLHLLRAIPIYRIPHVYLRLAEALNRLEKPTMAFAVLKYGLNNATLGNPLRVNPEELKGEVYTDGFMDAKYADNYGSVVRGRGYGMVYDEEGFIIPECATLEDSIQYVEDYIMDEMAAETCFEGNRFFDLLRVARHRGEYPAYMARKVAVRFGEDAEVMENKLMNEDVWYLK